MTQVLSTRPIEPFGVEAELAFRASPSDADQTQIARLYMRDGLLVARGLNLTMEEQRAMCGAFGPVPDSPYENLYVSNTRADGFLGTKELQWHNDVPYLPSPYLVAALHALDVDPDAASTRFVSGYRAYESLPDRLKARVEGMKALQVRQRVSERANRLGDLEAGDLCTVHPVVRAQEGTGRPYLFVNENMTACIIGLSAADSDALLEELFAYLYAEDAIYDHAWRPGDLVVWDNLSVQHARGQAGVGARTLQRVTCTRFTYKEQYPADSVGEDLHNATLFAPAA
ncbi:TauD/TfdA family dioxygenase [Novosphingobium sp. G106]|uniref:TauD/TfdA dioxygenase family protein n=1 Tax=Novosphingobium sp. G106 TaxID=2849500 RepID=UPI001C2CD41E|nr:TauD/TfdA family dioxygenase [Novosphingobium sp. G106]MBV1688405.1 TauD/TfdA family dioxygenase [Novosphingobium sp. G106]